MASLTETVRFIEGLFGRVNLARDERNVGVRCPICDPKDPTKKKLVIRLADHVTHCWVCGWSSRTLVPLVKKFGSREQLNHYVNSLSPIKVKRASLEPEQHEEKRLEIPSAIKLMAPNSEPSPDELAVIKYTLSRGLTEKDMWYYRLCTSQEAKWSRRVIFLSHDVEGSVNYVTGRTVDPRKDPRYLNSDVERNSIIFNELNVDWRSPLVLCEGPFDLVRCGDNATCLLGSEISEQSLLFDRIVSNGTPVILAMDADTHRRKRPKVIRKLMEYDVPVSLVDLGNYPDPGSAPKEFMLEQIGSASPVDWDVLFREKLENF